VQALVLSSRRQHAEAEELAHEAVAISEGSDILELQGDTHADLADVLEAAGRREEAAAALREALDRYEREEIVPLARRTRERLATLERAP
jgi:tetratricopeptide (TPR) repeat protein